MGLTRKHIIGLAAGALLLSSGAALAASLYIDAKALVGQVLLERAFAQTLETGEPTKPWDWADTWPVARVFAPAHNESAIVLAGASGEAMAWGPGHMAGTPKPGDNGISIIAAHRDTHFAFLEHVAPGDDISVTNADGSRHAFRVTGTKIMRWDQSGIDPVAPGKKLALVTCYPFNARTQGPLRYVVMTEKIEEQTDQQSEGPAVHAALDRLSPEVEMVR
ncbi:class GN sortase [Pyruvatibacter sp.]|uniref:class GN sortase n=1 Tax=Pyruvatibacter sp. TaxID=1981328 RepID=UPI003266DF7E